MCKRVCVWMCGRVVYEWTCASTPHSSARVRPTPSSASVLPTRTSPSCADWSCAFFSVWRRPLMARSSFRSILIAPPPPSAVACPSLCSDCFALFCPETSSLASFWHFWWFVLLSGQLFLLSFFLFPFLFSLFLSFSFSLSLSSLLSFCFELTLCSNASPNGSHATEHTLSGKAHVHTADRTTGT